MKNIDRKCTQKLTNCAQQKLLNGAFVPVNKPAERLKVF